ARPPEIDELLASSGKRGFDLRDNRVRVEDDEVVERHGLEARRPRGAPLWGCEPTQEDTEDNPPVRERSESRCHHPGDDRTPGRQRVPEELEMTLEPRGGSGQVVVAAYHRPGGRRAGRRWFDPGARCRGNPLKAQRVS